jgi:hypothetical protein
MEERLSAQDVIAKIRETMLREREELYSVTVVPASYQVFLHRADYEDLEGLFPKIVSQARQALEDDLRRVNREAQAGGRLRALVRKRPLPHEAAHPEWRIQFFWDTEERLGRGDFEVYCQLVVNPRPELGAGARTKRVGTLRRDGRTERAPEEERALPPGSDPERVLARLEYEDQTGRHVYRMWKSHIVIGRGGAERWVDLQLQTIPDVSREHARLRWDPETRAFFLEDRSKFGTTVDGVAVGPGEVRLPAAARLGLAGALFLDFQAEGA